MGINELFPEPELKFDTSNNKKYKVEAIKDSAVHAKKAEGHLPGLYYLIFWKDYLEEKNTWEPSSVVMHLWKIIFTFYKDYPKKLTATFPPLNSAPPMAKPLVKHIKPSVKRKRSHLTGSAKYVKQ